jgi:hypothetical protein
MRSPSSSSRASQAAAARTAGWPGAPGARNGGLRRGLACGRTPACWPSGSQRSCRCSQRMRSTAPRRAAPLGRWEQESGKKRKSQTGNSVTLPKSSARENCFQSFQMPPGRQYRPITEATFLQRRQGRCVFGASVLQWRDRPWRLKRHMPWGTWVRIPGRGMSVQPCLWRVRLWRALRPMRRQSAPHRWPPLSVDAATASVRHRVRASGGRVLWLFRTGSLGILGLPVFCPGPRVAEAPVCSTKPLMIFDPTSPTSAPIAMGKSRCTASGAPGIGGRGDAGSRRARRLPPKFSTLAAVPGRAPNRASHGCASWRAHNPDTVIKGPHHGQGRAD